MSAVEVVVSRSPTEMSQPTAEDEDVGRGNQAKGEASEQPLEREPQGLTGVDIVAVIPDFGDLAILDSEHMMIGRSPSPNRNRPIDVDGSIRARYRVATMSPSAIWKSISPDSLPFLQKKSAMCFCSMAGSDTPFRSPVSCTT